MEKYSRFLAEMKPITGDCLDKIIVIVDKSQAFDKTKGYLFR